MREQYIEKRRRRRRNRRICTAVVCCAVIAAACFLVKGANTEATEPKDLPAASGSVKTGTEAAVKSDVTSEASLKAGLDTKSATNPKGDEQGVSDGTQKVYYWEADKAERYDAYQKLHGELPLADVVWRVNACLDQPFYSVNSEITDISAKPLIPNKYYKLPDSFVPTDLVNLPSGRQVTADTKAAYDSMKADAAALNLRISEGSAYRSIKYQKEVYARYVKKDSVAVADTYSSRPGHSDHHTGEAIDLMAKDGSLTGFRGTAEAAWIEENAYKYGFIVRFPKDMDSITGYVWEPWHIRYVGKDIAKLMRDQGIKTLEEYKVKYIDHTPSSSSGA